MSMNKLMHPRNPYRKRPDFKQLAIDFPEFRKYAKADLSGKIKFNFKDQGAVWALTKCLLERDFDLIVEILPDRLVPTLPLRLNYLLWIEDLLKLYKPRNVFGIDIGTGASCIYPLLAARHLSWNMLGTEVDIDSIKCAMSNVENNFLSEKVSVKGVTEDVVLNGGALDDETTYDFCMCNPPFFSDSEELALEFNSRTNRRKPPHNAPTGIPSELVTPGGEVVFVARIIADSAILQDRVRIYTVMVGKKANLKPLKQMIEEYEEVSSVATTVFCQGRTTRWGLAWTFVPGLNLNQAPHTSTSKNRSSFAPFLFKFPLPEGNTYQTVKEKLFAILEDIKVITDVEETPESLLMTIKAQENTWINSRKKRRQEKKKQNANKSEVSSSADSVVVKPSIPEHMDVEMPLQENLPSSSVLGSAEIVNTAESSAQSIEPICVPADTTENIVSSAKTGDDTAQIQSDSKTVDTLEESKETEMETNVTPSSSERKTAKRPLPDEDYLVASLIMKEDFESNEILFELHFIEGSGGKDAANQLLFCIRNRLK